jgi:hypothetical protein
MSTKTAARTTVIALAAVVILDRASVVPVAAQDRVTTLLSQVRAALGGEQALAAVKAISVEGAYKRVAGARTLDSYVTLLLVRPDKMRRSDESRFFATTERITTFDGTQVWDEVVSGAGVGGGHGGFDHGGGGHGGGAAGDHGGWDHDGQHFDAASEPDAADADKTLNADQLAAARGRRMKMELQRWTIAFVAQSDRPFTAVSRAESPDGPADVLETTDEAGRPVRYIIDPNSHVPLMVQYQQVRAVAAPVAAPQANEPRRLEMRPASPPTKLATVAMHLSTFKKVDSVMLPHQIDISIDGQAAEGWTIEAVKINPKVKPNTFRKPAK